MKVTYCDFCKQVTTDRLKSEVTVDGRDVDKTTFDACPNCAHEINGAGRYSRWQKPQAAE